MQLGGSHCSFLCTWLLCTDSLQAKGYGPWSITFLVIGNGIAFSKLKRHEMCMWQHQIATPVHFVSGLSSFATERFITFDYSQVFFAASKFSANGDIEEGVHACPQ